MSSPDLADIASLTGLEQLRRALAGEPGQLRRPGIGALIGMDVDTLEEGRVAFTLRPGEAHTNPMGMVHGGIAATMLDSAMGCALLTTLEAGWGFTTLDLNVHFTRGVAPGSGLLRADGTVVHRGRRVATGEGRVTDEHGRLVAHATTTCMLLPTAG
ncbi:MAG: hotdog fold thioesterase [Acidimicrobiia bacterium]|nr:hotdog fold thioesterase [Acidimicrobiia bacterium]